jgi:hypothetical protein
MWGLLNRTAFAAERAWTRDRNGAEVWLVAIKGTYRIHEDGSTELTGKQTEVCKAPRFNDGPGESSLRYESDFALTKRGTDVLLHGHAYAPRGEAATAVLAGIKVADLSKVVRVCGDRIWEWRKLLGARISEPQPFTRMPLTYERAYGGWDRRLEDPLKHAVERRNPVGVGFAVEEEHLAGTPLPNVEDPRQLIGSWTDRPPPAGFGPIASHWSPRLELAGTYDERWQETRSPLLAADFDERFYHCAPIDQQTQAPLRGGERVELTNLTPSGVMRFQLPRARLGLRTRFANSGIVEHRPTLHSVIIEPDESRVMLVWHAALPCHTEVLSLQHTVIYEKAWLDQSAPVSREASVEEG